MDTDIIRSTKITGRMGVKIILQNLGHSKGQEFDNRSILRIIRYR